MSQYVPCSCNFNCSASLLEDNPDIDTIDDKYDRLGPTPHLCLRFNPLELKRYEDQIRQVLKTVTPRNLEELTEGPENLRMNALSHKISLVRRSEITNFWSMTIVTPITDHMRSRLALAMRNQNIHKQVEMFLLFNSLASSKALSGILFENICHHQFQRRIHIDYVPMVWLEDSKRRGNPQWHSSHYAIAESEQLERQRLGALGRLETLDVSPSDCIEYDGCKPFSLQENIYYIPMISNEVAFDSFICYDGHLYIFQFTVSKNHDIKKGLISRIPELIGLEHLPQREKWHFIFIIPDDGKTLKCPYCPEFQGLELHSSKLVMKDFIESILSFNPPQPMRKSPLSLKDEEDEEDEEEEHPPQEEIETCRSQTLQTTIARLEAKEKQPEKGKEKQI